MKITSNPDVEDHKKIIYSMKLHSIATFDDFLIMRVPGHWIYNFNVVPVPIVVPLSGEFKPGPKTVPTIVGERKSTALIFEILEKFPAADRREIMNSLKELRDKVEKETVRAL